ncbi:MAG: hypothetical protein AB7V42_00095 [Thermoleophilia bacterium]
MTEVPPRRDDPPGDPSDARRLDETLRGLPEAIAEKLRESPIKVKEVRSKWKTRLAVLAVLAGIGSAVYTVVANLTTDNVASRVAPIGRAADRVDRGISGVESAIDRVTNAADEATRDVSSGEGRRRVIDLGPVKITVETLPDGSRRTRIEGSGR